MRGLPPNRGATYNFVALPTAWRPTMLKERDWSQASWVDPRYGWKPLPVPAVPPRVLLDLATRCNMRCAMCPVWNTTDKQRLKQLSGVMPSDAVLRILDEIEASRAGVTVNVQPNMYGEPLLAPCLQECIHEVKGRQMALTMNTNGLTLDRRMAEFFVSEQVDSILFSLDAASPETFQRIRGLDCLDRIEDAVRLMLEVRQERPLPRIGVTFTTQDSNRHEETAFVEKWAGLVDVIRVGLVYENGTYPGMKTTGKRLCCPALYTTIPIHHDGRVTVCCLDGFKTTDMGNVFERGVLDVWHGEGFAKVRYFHETGQWSQVPFCTRCNGWAQYCYEEETRGDLLVRRSPQYTYYNRLSRLQNWNENLLSRPAT